MANMFEKLMKLPLFQGVSQERLAELVEKVPFHFLKFNDGEKIISAGDDCTHLRFVMSGSVKVVTNSEASRLSVTQVLDAPNVLGPDHLFGRSTVYPFDVYAIDTTGILQLRKSDYVEILQSDKVFLFNALNYLSRNSQNRTLSILSQSRGLIAERLASLILALTTPASREIKINFKQKDLCLLLGARRTSLVNALDEMKEKEILDYNISEISNVDRKALIQLIKA